MIFIDRSWLRLTVSRPRSFATKLDERKGQESLGGVAAIAQGTRA